MMRMNHAHAPRKRGSERALGGSNGSEPLRSEPQPSEKRPVNLSMRCDLIAAARGARVNLSALLERALSEELVRLKWRQWRDENGPAVAAYKFPLGLVMPTVEVEGESYLLVTPQLAGVSQWDLGPHTGSVASHSRAIFTATDILLR